MSDCKHTLTIPTWRTHDPDTSKALNHVTKLVGGVTITEARGRWFDEHGGQHDDTNLVFSWCVDLRKTTVSNTQAIWSAILDTVELVLMQGEKTVLYESLLGCSSSSYTFVLLDSSEIKQARDALASNL